MPPWEERMGAEVLPRDECAPQEPGADPRWTRPGNRRTLISRAPDPVRK